MRRLVPTGVAAFMGLVVAVAALALTPDTARAYGGPGSVVTGIGAFLAALAAVVAALFGFLWFPVKRLVAKLRGDDGIEGEDAGAAGTPAAQGDAGRE